MVSSPIVYSLFVACLSVRLSVLLREEMESCQPCVSPKTKNFADNRCTPAR